jgi:hypothetical protein
VLQARGIVGHAVGVAWEVLGPVTVAVELLVIARKPAQARRRARRGDRALPHPGDRRGVNREVLEGRVADVMSMRHEVDLHQKSRVFQVAVHDVPRRVVVENQPALHGVGEGFSPDKGIAPAVKVHSAHTVLSSICGPQQRGGLGHDLRETRGPAAQTGCEPAERVKAVMDEAVDPDSVSSSLVLCPLQHAEQTGGPGDGHRHKAQLPKVARHFLEMTRLREASSSKINASVSLRCGGSSMA